MSAFDDLEPQTGIDEFDPIRAMHTDLPEESPEFESADIHGRDVHPTPDATDDALRGGGRGTSLGADGQFDLSKGLIDPSGIVRLWVDEDLNLLKCRVSPRWREKFRVGGQRGSESAGLARAFAELFMIVNNTRLPVPEVTDDRGDLEPKPLSFATIFDLLDRSDALTARMAALGDHEGFGRWVGDAVSGSAEGGRVRVQLTARGDWSSVTFDRAWLDASRVGQINDAVIAAAHDARERFVPPVYEPGERDRIVAGRTQIEAELVALARKGFQ